MPATTKWPRLAPCGFPRRRRLGCQGTQFSQCLHGMMSAVGGRRHKGAWSLFGFGPTDTWMIQNFRSTHLPHCELFRPTSFPVLMPRIESQMGASSALLAWADEVIE